MGFENLPELLQTLIPWMAFLTMVIVLVGSALLLTWDIVKKARNVWDKRRSTFDPDIVIESDEEE